MDIVQEGTQVLRDIAEPIAEREFGGATLAKLLKDMALALDAQPDGVALAAPQIGVSKRIFITREDRMLPPTEEGAPVPPPTVGVFINPELIRVSRRKEEMDEGCLSVRGIYGRTKRHERATVKAYDADGNSFTRGAGGILAQAFQHEIDHLDGILFIDHAKHLVEAEHRDHA